MPSGIQNGSNFFIPYSIDGLCMGSGKLLHNTTIARTTHTHASSLIRPREPFIGPGGIIDTDKVSAEFPHVMCLVDICTLSYAFVYDANRLSRLGRHMHRTNHRF